MHLAAILILMTSYNKHISTCTQQLVVYILPLGGHFYIKWFPFYNLISSTLP